VASICLTVPLPFIMLCSLSLLASLASRVLAEIAPFDGELAVILHAVSEVIERLVDLALVASNPSCEGT